VRAGEARRGGVTPANRAAELPGFGVKLAVTMLRHPLRVMSWKRGQPSDFRVTLQNFSS